MDDEDDDWKHVLSLLKNNSSDFLLSAFISKFSIKKAEAFSDKFMLLFVTINSSKKK